MVSEYIQYIQDKKWAEQFKKTKTLIVEQIQLIQPTEITINKICGEESDSCKFELNKNISLFPTDVVSTLDLEEIFSWNIQLTSSQGLIFLIY